MHGERFDQGGLNPVQLEAVRAGEGPVLVLAGPGSGKTRVLTHRIAYLMDECGIPPYHILAVTFTNKAANEMKERLERLLGEETRRLTVGTFHAICVRILRREAERIGLSPSFSIFDADDQRRLVRRILKELNLDDKQFRPRSVHATISRAKNELLTPENYVPQNYRGEIIRRVFERYQEALRESGALDFDDLLVETAALLSDPETQAKYRRRYRHVLVDEFQDTNKAQYELVSHLTGEQRNVFVVGDEDQSIYSWRGADFRNVGRFQVEHADAKVFLLEQNYRSTQTILDAAQAVIARNKKRTAKQLWTSNGKGRRIRIYEAYNELEEAEYVAKEIQRLAAEGATQASDCAVMFRTNAQSRALEEAFVQRGMSYRLVGATRFYQRREIKDVLAYLRLLVNPDDEISLTRAINTPRRGIGPKTLNELANYAAQEGVSLGRALVRMERLQSEHGSTAETLMSSRSSKLLLRFAGVVSTLREAAQSDNLTRVLEQTLEVTGLMGSLQDGTEEGKERAENVQELLTVVRRFDDMPAVASLPPLLEEISLASDVDRTDWSGDAATLLTLHSAKGLEFDTVFMIGMEEGICPHQRSIDDEDQMEEERRLCYVGMTRAQQRLYLLRTFKRTLYGNAESRDPSRFLQDIPERLVKATKGYESRTIGTSSLTGSSSQGRRREAYRDLVSRRRSQADRVRSVSRDGGGSSRSRPTRAAGQVKPKRRRIEIIDGEERPRGARPMRNPAAYSAGDSVAHPLFGEGIVVSSRLVEGDEEVTVAFEGRGIKRLMASFAKLEKR